MSYDLNRSSSQCFESAGTVASFSTLRRHDERPDPKDNRLLARLIEAGGQEMLLALEGVSLPRGHVLCEPGDPRQYVYFPIGAIVALLGILENGTAAEFALTGNEGLVGTSVFMGGAGAPTRVMVLSGGFAYRLRADVLKKELGRKDVLYHLLRFELALSTQVAQTAACNRHHCLDQQLCRWLLMSLDRLPSNEIIMTQELIARMLGVRREGVTEAAGHLQHARLIQIRRGRITVLDRPKLEQRVCECYAVVKREYDRLLGHQRQHGTGAGRVPLKSTGGLRSDNLH